MDTLLRAYHPVCNWCVHLHRSNYHNGCTVWIINTPSIDSRPDIQFGYNVPFHIISDNRRVGTYYQQYMILESLIDKYTEKNNLEKSEFLIPDVVSELIKENKASVKLIPTTSRWYGVTYLKDKESVVKALEEMVLNCFYKEGLWI